MITASQALSQSQTALADINTAMANAINKDMEVAVLAAVAIGMTALYRDFVPTLAPSGAQQNVSAYWQGLGYVVKWESLPTVSLTPKVVRLTITWG